MPAPELDRADPNVAFGQNQGLYAYNMAGSLTGDSNRPVIERARDAVQTASRLFEQTDIDIELATTGLMGVLESGFDAGETAAERL